MHIYIETSSIKTNESLSLEPQCHAKDIEITTSLTCISVKCIQLLKIMEVNVCIC